MYMSTCEGICIQRQVWYVELQCACGIDNSLQKFGKRRFKTQRLKNLRKIAQNTVYIFVHIAGAISSERYEKLD